MIISVTTSRRILAASLLAAMACGLESAPNTGPTTTDPHAAAIAYLDSAITLMQRAAFYRRRVNWDSVRTSAHVQAAGATSNADTYGAIRQALLSLGDHHSFLQLPTAANLPPAGTWGLSSLAAGHRVDSLDGEMLNGRYGFIHVPTFSQSVPGSSITGLADSLQRLIRSVDASDPCGWIVDVRHNLGGNMWPMLAGIGPILGNDDRAGYFVDADSGISTWFYTGGVSGYTGPTGIRYANAAISLPPYTLRRPNPPVAVLTDSLTASSGEAIVVAFRGLPRARSFGGATYGVPTANSGYPLPDGAMLFLMVALDADRNMRWYSLRIPADEPVFVPAYPTTDDAIVTAAMNWLATQPACASS